MSGAVSLRLADVLAGTGGVRLRGHRDAFAAISTDSRSVREGELFWALSGPSFDGHDFVATAFARGAAGAVVEAGHPVELDAEAASDRVVIAVDDTLRALGDLAAYWRRARNPKVIAITGSNGKTTTKEMVARVVGARFPVLVTSGNLNNLIGMPLTMLRLREEAVAVVEMGMNAPGEIRRMAQIARPDVGLITQVAPAHLEGLGTIEGVADAKWELFEELTSHATALVNLDDPRLIARRPRLRCLALTFGVRGGDVHAEDIADLGLDGVRFLAVVAPGLDGVHRETQRAVVHLPLLGLHNVGNALGAIAAGAVLGVPVNAAAHALAALAPVPGRMCPRRLGHEVVVLDDTYNANPASMAAALATGARSAGVRRKIAVLGEMRELGAASAAAHREVGALVAREGFDLLVALGEAAQGYVAGARAAGMADARLRSIPSGDVGAAVDALGGALEGSALVVVKGSRGARMERVVAALVERLGEALPAPAAVAHG